MHPYASAWAWLPIGRATSARIVSAPLALDSQPAPGPQADSTLLLLAGRGYASKSPK